MLPKLKTHYNLHTLIGMCEDQPPIIHHVVLLSRLPFHFSIAYLNSYITYNGSLLVRTAMYLCFLVHDSNEQNTCLWWKSKTQAMGGMKNKTFLVCKSPTAISDLIRFFKSIHCRFSIYHIKVKSHFWHSEFKQYNCLGSSIKALNQWL